MIIVLLSYAEAEAFCRQCAEPELVRRIRNQMKLERLLPDNDLPHSVMLTHIDDEYACVWRTFDSAEAADRAWRRLGDLRDPAECSHAPIASSSRLL